MKKNIPLEEAQQIVLDNCTAVGTEKILLESALGRVLCEDIPAPENIPPFARSPFDGYAFRAEDTAMASKANPVILDVIEEVPAGHVPKNTVIKGKAVKILTGAPIPQGADAVTKFEETEIHNQRVSIFSSFRPGENIVPAGEDVAENEIIAQKGMTVSPPVLGIMAALGITAVPVYKRPRIAIISTGDELLDISEPLRSGMIRNSNSYTLAAYCRELGAETIVFPAVKDKAEAVGAAIEEGFKNADMVITTGGVSVGDYDVLQDAVDFVGARLLYWKIEIKPGSPNLAAVKDGKLLLALSGNPAAALVIFHLLGTLYIKKLAGYTDYNLDGIEITLKNDFNKPSPRRRFLRGKLIIDRGKALMEITGRQGNGVLRSLIGCDVLAEIPEGSGPQKAGTKLNAFLLTSRH